MAGFRLSHYVSGGLVLVFAAAAVSGSRLNTSPSLPAGLYVPGGNLALFCPEEPYASLALRRQYRIAGSCPDGGEPLLKPVVARAGDAVQMSAVGISVNGKLLENTAPLMRDSAGRPIAPYPAGTYKVQPGTVWVASSYSAKSFDSRYFGAVEESRITSYLQPLLVR
jgi:conjugative transfer signal peptidase TraF